ncbi:DUF4905 domain-containing protein [Dyadobacter sp. CY343]|uniref:DUF4905 domain-containing protein n=1 Tax=Dyadobacter sp. CY343 TaxID=2907299 RepID=UPI001F2674B0|nr:DUF4905 domain-containing protein [Dyadobacter sp. CY343]MCE7059046.1 DUF4905 domain-containing protein [Dyadobacter sp. CY343]
MQKLFSYTFSQHIWRIIPDANPGSGQWAIELRDTEKKIASVAILDLSKEGVIWQGIPEGMDWWASMTAFSNGTFFLHHYRYPDLPEPTDLSAFSAQTGEILWSLPNYLMVRVIDDHTIEVATKTAVLFTYKHCDVRSGSISAQSESQPQQENQIILTEPVRYKKGNSFFDKLASFISKETGGHEPISIDYLEKRPYIIFSYYIYHQDKTAQYLLIVTDRGESVLHEKLSEERAGIGRSTMLLKASTLVYLRNNNEFSSLTLS